MNINYIVKKKKSLFNKYFNYKIFLTIGKTYVTIIKINVIIIINY